MRREIAEGCHVPGRTDRGLKTPRRSAERRCRVPLSSGDPEDMPRPVTVAPFGASAPSLFRCRGHPEPPDHVKQFAGSDDARPDGGETMQNIAAQHFWDVQFLKDRQQAGLERQFDQDWERARTEALRDLANDMEHHCGCRSARCRRARRCVGTDADCRRRAERELQPEELQQEAEEVYLRLQQERRAAAYAATKLGPSSVGRHGPRECG